jgi:hypothetical protein
LIGTLLWHLCSPIGHHCHLTVSFLLPLPPTANEQPPHATNSHLLPIFVLITVNLAIALAVAIIIAVTNAIAVAIAVAIAITIAIAVAIAIAVNVAVAVAIKRWSRDDQQCQGAVICAANIVAAMQASKGRPTIPRHHPPCCCR